MKNLRTLERLGKRQKQMWTWLYRRWGWWVLWGVYLPGWLHCGWFLPTDATARVVCTRTRSRRPFHRPANDTPSGHWLSDKGRTRFFPSAGIAEMCRTWPDFRCPILRRWSTSPRIGSTPATRPSRSELLSIRRRIAALTSPPFAVETLPDDFKSVKTYISIIISFPK